MVKPAEKRALVAYTRKKYKISARRACGLLERWESSLYYQHKGRNVAELRAALHKHPTANPGWGVSEFDGLAASRRDYR